jgi:hypothetical protein
MANVLVIVLWILFFWFIGFWAFGVVECIIRPISYPFYAYQAKGCKGINILWIVLLIVPGYMLFGMIHWIWALPQIVLNFIPYCEHKCSDLEKKFPDNVRPIIWTPTAKHPVYRILLKFVGQCIGASLKDEWFIR